MRTKEQIKTEAKNYINKCSDHLFVNSNNTDSMMKILKINDDKYIGLYFNVKEETLNVEVFDKDNYRTENKFYLKEHLFPMWEKHHSIRQYKSVREKFGRIKEMYEKGDVIKPSVHNILFADPVGVPDTTPQ